MLQTDKKLPTFGEAMEIVEESEKRLTDARASRNKEGRKMYAKIIVVSSDYVDDLTEQIIKHSIPDEMKIWSNGIVHYAMLFYRNWNEQG